jgi:hypothetical protein
MVMQHVLSGRDSGSSTQSFQGRTAPAIPMGLTLLERGELEWFWNGYEADVGFRSSFQQMVVAIVQGADEEWGGIPKVGGGGHDVDAQVYHDRMYGLHCHGVFRRADAIYRALKTMPEHHLVVLYLLHGPGRRNAPTNVFGDVAPIAHLTAAAEEARQAMAEREGAHREERADEGTAAAIEDHREGLARTFWEAVGEYQACERRLGELMAIEEPTEKQRARIEAAQDRHRAWWSVCGKALVAYRDAGARAPAARRSASSTAKASAARELTPQQAIRWKLDYHGPRGKDGKPQGDAKRAHDESRKAFIAAVKKDAERMKIAAANAYRAAKREVRS